MHRKQFVYIIVTFATRVKPNLDFSTTFFLYVIFFLFLQNVTSFITVYGETREVQYKP